MNIDKLADLWLKVLAALEKLRWSSIAKATVIMLICIAGYIFYDNKEPFYKQYLSAARVGTGHLPNPPSELTQDAVKKLVAHSDIIGGAQLVNANFERHSRVVVFTYADDWNIKYWFDEFYRRRKAPTPIFLLETEEGYLENNLRMVAIINGKFDCQDFDKSILNRNIPELKGKVSMICSMSIPPYFGYFSGYLTLYLIRPPTVRELEDLRADARALSVDIYDREFQR